MSGGGICLDCLRPDGAPSIEQLRDLGVSLVRMQARHDDQMWRYHNDCKNAGLETVVVLDSEAYASDIDEHALHVRPSYWVISNEMDAYLLDAESGSSWSMTPAEYSELWHESAGIILARQPEATLVVGGLVSGQTWWADNLKPLLDPEPWAWDIHPYGKDVELARTLLRIYGAVLGTDIMVLEWHKDADEIAAYQKMLWQEVDGSAYFAWHDVDELGLHDSDGNQKAEYHAYKETLKGKIPMGQMEVMETREDWRLGPRWENLAIEEWKRSDGNTMRRGHYTDGVAEEIVAADGRSLGVWQLPHVDSFR